LWPKPRSSSARRRECEDIECFSRRSRVWLIRPYSQRYTYKYRRIAHIVFAFSKDGELQMNCPKCKSEGMAITPTPYPRKANIYQCKACWISWTDWQQSEIESLQAALKSEVDSRILAYISSQQEKIELEEEISRLLDICKRIEDRRKIPCDYRPFINDGVNFSFRKGYDVANIESAAIAAEAHGKGK
jgi:transposase-like protein